MSDWKAKRFWEAANVADVEGGFTVTLDGRPIRTPAKSAVTVPTRALAQALALEWDAQDKIVDPNSMPLTRLANSVIDKVLPQKAAVADMIAEYGGSDFLCYRAQQPQGLVDRQVATWTPFLEWIEAEEQITLNLQAGIMPVEQSDLAHAKIHALTHELDGFALTAFHELVTISGSWVLGLAVLRGAFDPDVAWKAARVDESWQAEQWGEDEEAAQVLAYKRDAFLNGHKFGNLASKS